MFFGMSLAPSYLEATATVATVTRAVGDLDALVAISQMTVSQMDALSMSESHQQRLHWLSEQVLNWSGLPVVHVRPTVFLDSPLFTTLAEQVLARAGLGPYVDEHLATMARLHRENRYDRVTATVEEITGRPAESVEEFVARRSDLFAK
jgi:uncharacterized protein YbjT (DUF2867 family)